MKIRIENEYTDGCNSVLERDVDAPEPDQGDQDALEALWDELYQYVGDGHGIGRRDLGVACKITILETSQGWLEKRIQRVVRRAALTGVSLSAPAPS